MTMVFLQYGNLLAIRNRRVSLLQSNPLWGPRQNLVVPVGMVFTAVIAIVNLYGPGLQAVFGTTPIPAMFWGPPFAFALAVLILDELRKLIVRTYPKVSGECTRGMMTSDRVGIVDRCQDGMVTYWHGSVRLPSRSICCQQEITRNSYYILKVSTTYIMYFGLLENRYFVTVSSEPKWNRITERRVEFDRVVID